MGKSGGLAAAVLAGVLAVAEREPADGKGLSAEVRASLMARAQRQFEERQAAWAQAPGEAVVAWKFARACFDWAEFATNQAQRAAVAQEGIRAGRSALVLDTNLAASPYYLGLNLGQLARVKRFTALGLIEEMREQFEAARRLEERFDFAGPDRNLGLLHHQAPGWPISLGDRARARRHLERAVELEPGYPENRLNLLEARLDWRDKAGVAREVQALIELLPEARRQFSGEHWMLSWEDWDRRWAAAQRRATRLGAIR